MTESLEHAIRGAVRSAFDANGMKLPTADQLSDAIKRTLTDDWFMDQSNFPSWNHRDDPSNSAIVNAFEADGLCKVTAIESEWEERTVKMTVQMPRWYAEALGIDDEIALPDDEDRPPL